MHEREPYPPIRINRELHRAAKIAAAEHRISMAQLATEALERELARLARLKKRKR